MPGPGQLQQEFERPKQRPTCRYILSSTAVYVFLNAGYIVSVRRRRLMALVLLKLMSAGESPTCTLHQGINTPSQARLKYHTQFAYVSCLNFDLSSGRWPQVPPRHFLVSFRPKRVRKIQKLKFHEHSGVRLYNNTSSNTGCGVIVHAATIFKLVDVYNARTEYTKLMYIIPPLSC